MGRGRKSSEGQTERAKLEDYLSKHTEGGAFKAFTELLNLADKEKLDEAMLETAKYQQGLKNLKDADMKLQEAKAKVAEQNRMHSENKKATEKRLRLIAIVISERFGDKIMDQKPSGE